MGVGVSGNLYLELSRRNQTHQAELWPLAIISYWSAGKLSSIRSPSGLLSAYETFLFTTENCKLQIQRKNSGVVCLSRPRVPTSPPPTSHVQRPGVPESHVTASPRPTSRCPRVLASQVPHPRPTFSHSRFSARFHLYFFLPTTFYKKILNPSTAEFLAPKYLYNR